MSTNSIEEILKKNSDQATSLDYQPKRRKRRRLYDNLEKENLNKKVSVSEQREVFAPVDEKIVTNQRGKISDSAPLLPKKIIYKKKNLKKERIKVKTKVMNALKRPLVNFTAIHNEFFERILLSNFSVIEMRFILFIVRKTLGWNDEVAYLSRSQFNEEGNIPLNRLDKVKNTLAHNGVIGIVSDPSTNKKGYYLRSDFLLDTQKQEVPKKEEERKILELIKDKNIRTSESKVLDELIKSGLVLSDIENVVRDLIEKGDLKGAPCKFPFSYINKGAYEAVLNRFEGKDQRGLNIQKIWEALTMYNTNEQLPEDFKSQLSDEDLQWIESRGGRNQLGRMSESKIKKELGIF
jgi:hypothetical protein